MIRDSYSQIILQLVRNCVPVLTCGVITVVVSACVLFGIQTYFNLNQGLFSVGAPVFQYGHIHRLFIHPFYHKTLDQLLLSILALMILSGSLEKGFGTVRFLFIFLLLSTTTGMLYSFLDLLQTGSSHAEGLVPVALACVAMTTMHTKMNKGFLCGVSFPTVVLPVLLLLITTALIPHCVLPCNIIAVLVGWTFGKGWFSLLDMSEARAESLEKTTPFRLLRSMSGGMFVPASVEERRKILLPRISPVPGSYPVQVYAPLCSMKAADTMTYEGWHNSPSALSHPTLPLHPYGHGSTHHFGINHDHGCNHTHHGHSHGQL